MAVFFDRRFDHGPQIFAGLGSGNPGDLGKSGNYPLGRSEFLARFEAAALGGDEYAHRDHLRTVWLYLRQRGREEAESAVRDGIRRLSPPMARPGATTRP